MNTRFSESVVEDAALAWLEALGHAVLHGPDIAAGEPGAECSDPNHRDVLLERRLRQALVRVRIRTFLATPWTTPTASSRATRSNTFSTARR